MPENLIFTGPRRLLYLAEKRFLPTLALGSAAALGLMGLFSVGQGFLARYYSSRTQVLQEKQNEARRELAQIEGLVEQLQQRREQLDQQIGWNNRRAEYLKTYRDKSAAWGTVFREVKRLIPYGIWLTEIDASPQGRVRLGGGAFEEDLVTRFMGELKEDPTFTEVAFNFTKKDRVGKTVFVRFEVTCQLASRSALTEIPTEQTT